MQATLTQTAEEKETLSRLMRQVDGPSVTGLYKFYFKGKRPVCAVCGAAPFGCGHGNFENIEEIEAF